MTKLKVFVNQGKLFICEGLNQWLISKQFKIRLIRTWMSDKYLNTYSSSSSSSSCNNI